jgi:hypothetical protein
MTLSMSIKPTNEGSPGCHGNRNGKIKFSTAGGGSWSAGKGIGIAQFRADGTVNAGGSSSFYDVGEWNSFKTTYERSNGEVTQKTYVNGQELSTSTRETKQFEDELSYLEVHSGDYTLYVDDISVKDAADGETGDPVYSPATGHYYEFVKEESITWKDARDEASGSTYQGMDGYLVTVTSQAEQDFLAPKIQAKEWVGDDNSAGDGLWIGATDAGEEDIWRWVTGPEGKEDGGKGRHFFTQDTFEEGNGHAVNGNFENFARTEPNDAGGDEDYAHYFANKNSTWNDNNNYVDDIDGYIIEYGRSDTGGNNSYTESATVTAGTVNLQDPGDTAETAVSIDASGGIKGADVTVSVDNPNVEIVDASIAEQPGESFTSISGQTSDSVDIGYTDIGGSSQQVDLANLRLRATGDVQSRSSIDVSVPFVNVDGTENVDVTTESGTILPGGSPFGQPLIPGFTSPPENTAELDATLYEDLDGDGDGTEVTPAVKVFGQLIRGNDLGLTSAQASRLDWDGDNGDSVDIDDIVALFGEKIRAG